MPKGTEVRIPLDDLLVFHQLTRSLTSSFELDAILRAILEQMERIVHADLWTLLMREGESDDLYYAIASNGKQAALREVRVKVGEGVAGWVVEHGETLIVPEAEDDPRVQAAGGARPARVRSVIAIPLRGRKGTHGAIEIYNPSAARMSDYTIAFLHILADHAAIAIENSHDVARIQQLTITDDTTGLYNVRHLYDVLTRELDLARNRRVPVSLAFLDLDRFKLVNDAHGHLVGSLVLAQTGQRLRELSRAHDLCFRYGGDEFVILMPSTEAEEALRHVQSLHRALLESEFRISPGLALSVSASVGVATAPCDGKTVHAVLGAADSRMYAVKTSGRGQVRGA
jgi:diguanylate cyclase (GGDEF)-like protein